MDTLRRKQSSGTSVGRESQRNGSGDQKSLETNSEDSELIFKMPKKKGGKKGAKIVDGIATSEMSRDQLVGHVRRIQMELDREREERNFFMLEREKLFALWNIAMEQLHAQKIKTRLAVEQMTEHDEQKQMELMMHKQKLRFLLTEQSKRVDEGRLQNLHKLQKAQDDMLAIRDSMKNSVEDKSNQVRQCQHAMHQLLRQLKTENAKIVSQVRNDTCLEISRLERDFLRLLEERQNRDEIAIENERELVKNKHTEQLEVLKQLHAKEMKETKNYFHSITINSIATITALQDELKDMKEAEKLIARKLKEADTNILKMRDRLEEEQEERKHLAKKDAKVGVSIKNELRKIREAQKAKDKYTRHVEMANEALIQKMGLIEGECKAFKSTVTKAILDMQQEAAMKRMILELKLKAASVQNQVQVLPVANLS